jgi:hypothetical protein
VNLSLVLRSPFRRTLLCVGVGVVFALGCNSGPMQMDITVEEPACVGGALSMTFTVLGSNPISLVTYQGGSADIVGTPTIIPGTNNFDVVAELNGVPINQHVTLKFSGISSMNASFSIQNVQFYTVPPAQLPQQPECPPAHGPVIGTNDQPGLGTVLEVSNPTPVPIQMLMLELVESPAVLSNSEMEWGHPTLEALPWAAPIAPGTMLPPGSPPMVIDLPDALAPSTHATLLRYMAAYNGATHRAIVQGDVTNGSVATEPSTWGKVKALYRAHQD